MSRVRSRFTGVSDVCQINEVDHPAVAEDCAGCVSDVCQINEVDHFCFQLVSNRGVSDVCQINEVDHGT